MQQCTTVSNVIVHFFVKKTVNAILAVCSTLILHYMDIADGSIDLLM